MLERSLEIAIGAIIVFAALFFFVFSLSLRSDNIHDTLYPLSALYNYIGGLKKGDNIKIAGVSIGHVDSISIDEDTYNARVILSISSSVKIPQDSKAQVMIGGLFGNNEIRILPGKSQVMLTPKSQISRTIDAFNIEDVIGELLYNAADPSP